MVRALEDETLARVPEDETFVYRCGWRVHFQPRREISVTRELNSDASSVALTSNRRVLFVGTVQGPVEIFDVRRRVWVDRLGQGNKGPSYVAVSSDGRWLAVAYEGAKKPELHEVSDPYVLTRRVIEIGLEEPPIGVQVLPNAEGVYVFDSKGFTLWDPKSGKQVRRVAVPVGDRPIVLSGGRFALTARGDAVCSVDLQSGAVLRCVRVAELHAMALAPDGRTLYVTGKAGITVIDLRDGQGVGR